VVHACTTGSARRRRRSGQPALPHWHPSLHWQIFNVPDAVKPSIPGVTDSVSPTPSPSP